MRQFQFSTPAAEELTAAIRWYESRRSGLGGEFYDAVVRTIERIQQFPEIGTTRRGHPRHRRMQVSQFPYTIAYRVREDDIYVVAVAHYRRRPDYWKNRR